MKQPIKRIQLALLLTYSIACSLQAQKIWSVDRCMEYAVVHSRTVKQRQLETDNYRAEKIKAIGQFLPGINGNVNAQYSFGRSVDPETNTFISKSTFNNGYGMEASLTIFKGGGLINQIKQSKVNLLLGKATQQNTCDQTALETFQAYIDALYFYGSSLLAQQKLAESDSLLTKIRRQEQLGLKGRADVAQMEAQQATDDYYQTKQKHLYQTALLTLKQTMNFPVQDSLVLDTNILTRKMREQIELSPEQTEEIFRLALHYHPLVKQAKLKKEAMQIQRRIIQGTLAPSITLFGGMTTSYYKELHHSNYPSFRSQFNNNIGSYIGISMSFPLFNRLSGLANVKQARNNALIAEEEYEAQKEELKKMVQQAVQDRENYLRESIQMEKKVLADSLAYHITRRKFEEGLMSSLDVQHNAAILLESRTALLQSKLTYIMKCRLVDYYKGKDIIRKEMNY